MARAEAKKGIEEKSFFNFLTCFSMGNVPAISKRLFNPITTNVEEGTEYVEEKHKRINRHEIKSEWHTYH